MRLNSPYADEIAGYLPWLVDLRRFIHAHPESGPEQPETVAFIAENLRSLGLAPDTQRTGCVVDIAGTLPGLAQGFRADMDALDLVETTRPDYLSVRGGFRSLREGKMHACGHDFHCAILLGLARFLALHREELRGRVRLLFQPGEEGFGGAKRMVRDGMLEGFERVYALHVHPHIPVGAVGFRPGVLFASISKLQVKVTGKGGHGAMPHLATDQVLLGAKMICELQSIVARRIDPTEPAVLSICYVHAGEPAADNVIPRELEFRGTIRTLNDGTQKQIGEEITRRLENLARAEGQDVGLGVKDYRVYRETVNSELVCQEVTRSFQRILGPENVNADFPITMGAEDFSEMLAEVPGVMFWLGARPKDKEALGLPMLHHPEVELDEDCLLVGTTLFAHLALGMP
ncbi:MAG: M20 family metallopeptidase [candidate division WOR-3 bacterium]